MTTKEKWLQKAYEHFAEYGPEALRIQKIASELDVPRTTFYHHFADMEDLVTQLLERYIIQVDKMIKNHKDEMKQLIPDLYELMSENPLNLKFGRQLFLNRSNPVYNMVFIKSREKTNRVLVPLFIEYYQLNIPLRLAEDVWNSMAESWYSRLQPDDLDAGTLQKLAEEIMESILAFARTKLFAHLKDL